MLFRLVQVIIFYFLAVIVIYLLGIFYFNEFSRLQLIYVFDESFLNDLHLSQYDDYAVLLNSTLQNYLKNISDEYIELVTTNSNDLSRFVKLYFKLLSIADWQFIFKIAYKSYVVPFYFIFPSQLAHYIIKYRYPSS